MSGKHFHDARHMHRVHFFQPSGRTSSKNRTMIASITGRGRALLHACPTTPAEGVNPMLSAPPTPSSHDEDAFAKLSSRQLPSCCPCSGCHRRSLAIEADDEAADGPRSSLRKYSMLAGQLGVREDVTEHRRHVGVEGHSPAKQVGDGWSARHRKAGQRAVAAATAG